MMKSSLVGVGNIANTIMEAGKEDGSTSVLSSHTATEKYLPTKLDPSDPVSPAVVVTRVCFAHRFICTLVTGS